MRAAAGGLEGPSPDLEGASLERAAERGTARRGLRLGRLAARPAHRGGHPGRAGAGGLLRATARRTRCSRSSPRSCRRACSRRPRGSTRVRRELDEYFEGRRKSFDLPIDWSLTRGFTRGVLQATARIPYGEVGTYASVAGEAGSPRAVRAAGNALGANPMPVVVPCHRVLRTGGALGGYTGGIERKEFLLRLEGRLP